LAGSPEVLVLVCLPPDGSLSGCWRDL